MLKKGLIIAAGIVLVLGLLFGRSGFSYVSTAVGKLQQSVKDSVPVEFDLERAKNAIRDLDPEIRSAMHEIAREEVEVDKLGREIAKAQADLDKSKSDIMTLKSELESGKTEYVFHGRAYTPKAVEEDLTRRFENFKTKQAMTDKLDKIMAARSKSLQAAREKLEGMLASKKQLEIEVANLEAQMKMIEVAKQTSELNLDDSHLSRTRQLIDDIKTKLEVESKLVQVEDTFHEEIQLDEPKATGNISQEITEYFSGSSTEYASSK